MCCGALLLCCEHQDNKLSVNTGNATHSNVSLNFSSPGSRGIHLSGDDRSEQLPNLAKDHGNMSSMGNMMGMLKINTNEQTVNYNSIQPPSMTDFSIGSSSNINSYSRNASGNMMSPNNVGSPKSAVKTVVGRSNIR